MSTIFDVAHGRIAADTDRGVLEERIVNEGLRGRWYALVGSKFVTEKPVRIQRLGENLVVWRDSSRHVHVQEDRCPHRGARLSQGTVFADNITCPYHGVQIDQDGRIALVPALPGCPIEGRLAVTTYQAHEYADVIFAYFPTPAGETAPPLVGPPEFNDENWSLFVSEMTWNSNWRYVVENALDVMHGPYLHGNSHTMSVGLKDDTLDIKPTEHGFHIERMKQQGVAFDYTDFVDEAISWVFLDVQYPPIAGPGGAFRIVAMATPIDETHCRAFFWRLRKVQGWERDLWRFLYRQRLEARHWAVLEQDRVCLEGLPDDAREREILYQHDVGVTRFRRALKALAREQLTAALQPGNVRPLVPAGV